MRKLGIDLGTTNTCIFHASWQVVSPVESFSLVPVKIYYSEEQAGDSLLPTAYSMPSAIYGVEDPEKQGGYRFYIGEAAVRKAHYDHAVELINTKRLICIDKPNKEIRYNLNAEDVATMLLKHCYESAKEELEWKIGSAYVCVTQPAASSIFATTSLERAAMKAGKDGFQKAEPLQEPIAALLSYLYTQLKNDFKAEALLADCQKNNNKLLTLVIDIGGGTTDVTIQDISVTGQRDPEPRSPTATGYKVTFLNRLRKENGASPVAAANQDPAFGGLDFDTEIVKKIIYGLDAKYEKKFGTHVNWATPDARRFHEMLFKRVQNIKNGLADKPDKEEYTERFEHDGFLMEFSFTKSDIYEWTEPLCYKPTGEKGSERTIYGIIIDTISRSGYRIEDIDRIFVTGGMSLYEPVRRMLKTRFSQINKEGKLVFSKEPLEDIAKGAALYNCYFKVNMPPACLFSDLILDDPVGTPCVLVEKNSELPKKGIKENFMSLRNPSNLYLDVLWGQGPDDCGLKFLRRLKTALPKGKVTSLDTPISVEYEINTHQALTITLIIHDPNGAYPITVIDLIKDLKEINVEEDHNA